MLSIKGTPQKIEVVGRLDDVVATPQEAAAVAASMGLPKVPEPKAVEKEEEEKDGEDKG